MATTLLEHALLGLLAMAPASGYDLRRALRNTPTRLFSSSPGSVYPALRRLEERGLVRSNPDGRGAARPRRQFRPTRTGLSELYAWVRAPVTRAEIEADISVPLLRFGFAELCMSRADTLAFLEGFRDALSAHIEDLRALAESRSASPYEHRALVLEHDIDTRTASLRWANDALARLRSTGG